MADTSSRTSKSLKNIIIALIFLATNILLQFISRKVFLEQLGTEVLGLNTTATNLLQFLNLAELGIGMVVGFALYKPLFEDDRDTINEILTLQGHLYRRIAFLIIGAALLISCFFPLIFEKMKLPLWYAYASFGVLLLSSLLSYFINYREILLTADQKEYKILYSFRTVMLLRVVVQIIVLQICDEPYIWWLLLEGGFAVAAALTLNFVIHREYPYLRRVNMSLKELSSRYPQIVRKTMQAFFHKVNYVVIQQSSPLVIYALASLSLVTLYGNYQMIILGVMLLLNALFNGVNAGVGNLIAEGNMKSIMSVFDEIFCARLFVCAMASFTVFMLADPFVVLWIGEEYLLPRTTLALMAVSLFITSQHAAVDAFVAGYGLFQDVWAAVVESATNITFSVLLGYYWGLDGVILGTLPSQIFMHFLWKPYFLYSRGFHLAVRKYFMILLRNMIAICLASVLVWWLLSFTSLTPASGLGDLLLYALIVVAGYSVALLFFQLILTDGMRTFAMRMFSRLRRS